MQIDESWYLRTQIYPQAAPIIARLPLGSCWGYYVTVQVSLLKTSCLHMHLLSELWLGDTQREGRWKVCFGSMGFVSQYVPCPETCGLKCLLFPKLSEPLLHLLDEEAEH